LNAWPVFLIARMRPGFGDIDAGHPQIMRRDGDSGRPAHQLLVRGADIGTDRLAERSRP
jgi:hypothetical protein